MPHPPPARVRHDSTVGRSFLKLGVGEAAARIIAFGATVYLARTLGASTYGVIVLATAVMLYLTFLTDCGVDALGVREVAAAPEALPTLLPSTLGARLMVGTALMVLTVVVGALLPQPDGAIIAAYAFTLPIYALGTRWVHLGLEQSGRASIGRLLSECVTVVLVLALVRGPDDLGRVPMAQVVGEGLGAIILLRLLPAPLRALRVVLEPARIRTLLQQSWPLIAHALLGLAIFNSDFIFLRIFRDSAAVGIYAAAYALISFFLNLGATYTTLLPVMTRVRDDRPAVTALYDGSLAQVLAGAIPVAVGGALVAPRLIVLVFGADYLAATLPLQILLWSIPVALIRNVSQSALIAYQRQDQLMLTAAWAAGINVALNVALIPGWGLAGAAVATLATEVLRTALAARYTHRLGLPMSSPWRFRRVIVASAAMAAVVWWLGQQPLGLVVAGGALAYLLALTAAGGITLRQGALPELTP
ncbi:MAG: flippase [Gemmatimonadetes bacterium]|nr:flippase [Gemmatimonadota bacterium]